MWVWNCIFTQLLIQPVCISHLYTGCAEEAKDAGYRDDVSIIFGLHQGQECLDGLHADKQNQVV